jgi:hypothetical protein
VVPVDLDDDRDAVVASVLVRHPEVAIRKAVDVGEVRVVAELDYATQEGELRVPVFAEDGQRDVRVAPEMPEAVAAPVHRQENTPVRFEPVRRCHGHGVLAHGPHDGLAGTAEESEEV